MSLIQHQVTATTLASAQVFYDDYWNERDEYCYDGASLDHTFANLSTDSNVIFSQEYIIATEFDDFTSFEFAVTFAIQKIHFSEFFNHP